MSGKGKGTVLTNGAGQGNLLRIDSRTSTDDAHLTLGFVVNYDPDTLPEGAGIGSYVAIDSVSVGRDGAVTVSLDPDTLMTSASGTVQSGGTIIRFTDAGDTDMDIDSVAGYSDFPITSADLSACPWVRSTQTLEGYPDGTAVTGSYDWAERSTDLSSIQPA